MKLIVYCFSFLLALFFPTNPNAQDVSLHNSISIHYYNNSPLEIYSQSNNPLLDDHCIIAEDDDFSESERKEAAISKTILSSSPFKIGNTALDVQLKHLWSSLPNYFLHSSLFIFISVFRL
jgi:hypothetical protein